MQLKHRGILKKFKKRWENFILSMEFHEEYNEISNPN